MFSARQEGTLYRYAVRRDIWVHRVPGLAFATVPVTVRRLSRSERARIRVWNDGFRLRVYRGGSIVPIPEREHRE